jgi:predicted O-methyltransferase YrrM
MSLLRSNLLPRLRLLRIALTQRFIYRDLISMVRDYGPVYNDVTGDTGPLDFAAHLLGPRLESCPDFPVRIAPLATFTPPGAPGIFNSEPSVSRFLAQLVFHARPRTVVELGCFVGWTSVHLAMALEARGSTGRLFCVDYQQDYLDVTRANLDRHGVAHVAQFVRGMSMDSAVLASLPPRPDIVFLDTSHEYPDTLREIETYLPRLTPGGFLVIHDTISIPGSRRSLAALRLPCRRLSFATERGNGVTVLQPLAP